MNPAKKENIIKVIGMVIVAVTLFQGLIPAMPGVSAPNITLISSIAMYLVSTLTVWKQRLSEVIDNVSTIPTIILAIVATIGGLNQLFDVVTLSDLTSQWLRFGITASTAILGMVSSIFYPAKQ